MFAGREGPWDSKGWVSEPFILRIFIFQLREFQVHVCLFSRRDWMNLFWMRGMATGTGSACAWPKSTSLDVNYPRPSPLTPSLRNGEFLKLEENMPAVVVVSELRFRTGSKGDIFKERRPAPFPRWAKESMTLWGSEWLGSEEQTVLEFLYTHATHIFFSNSLIHSSQIQFLDDNARFSELKFKGILCKVYSI